MINVIQKNKNTDKNSHLMQRCRVFVRNDLVKRKIKSCTKSSKGFLEFKKKFGLDPNVVTCDEQNIISALQVAFEG